MVSRRSLVTDVHSQMQPVLNGSEEQQPAPPPVAATADILVLTSIHLQRSVLNRLRQVALNRAISKGTRSSVSKVVSDLVEQHLAELEQV